MFKRPSWTAAAVIALVVFTVINPLTSLDTLAFLAVAFILLHKIFGEYAALALLAARPTLDYWRDVVIFNYENINFNINAGLAVLLFVWAAYFFVKNKEYWRRLPLKLPWLIFILWCAFSFIWSFDRGATLIETVKAADLFALFGVAYILRAKHGPDFDKKFYGALLGAAVLPLLLGFYQLLTHGGQNIDDVSNRIFGTFAHPNILATFALFLIMALTDFVASKKEKINSKLLTAGYALLFAVVAFTYTRIAWVGLAVFLLLVGWRYFRRLVVAGVVAVVIFYALFFPVNHLFIDYFNFNWQSISIVARLTTRNEDADSIKWRQDVFNKVLPLYAARPVWGYGYGAFAKVWDDNKSAANIWDTTSEAHNDYLKVAFETGGIGLALFLWIFAALMWREIKFGRGHGWKNIAIIASVLVYLILGLSDNMLHHTPVIWWLWSWWGFKSFKD